MCDFHISRRRFIECVSVAAAGAAFFEAGKSSAGEAAVRETADLILGPFYPQRRPVDSDADLTLIRGRQQRAAGQVVQLSGRLLTVRGEPLQDTRIDVWQANTNGRYDHPSDPNIHLALDPNFQGFAELRTDRDGRYSFTTIKPGPYPTARGDMRAPHIHFEVHGAIDRKVTQLFFPGEQLNAQDRHLNSVRRPETLIARIGTPSSGSVVLATWDIVLTTG